MNSPEWMKERVEGISFVHFDNEKSLVAVPIITYAVAVYCKNNGGPYNSCEWCVFLKVTL